MSKFSIQWKMSVLSNHSVFQLHSTVQYAPSYLLRNHTHSLTQGISQECFGSTYRKIVLHVIVFTEKRDSVF